MIKEAPMIYLVRSPELNVCIMVAKGDTFQWFVDMILEKLGTITVERLNKEEPA